MKGALLVGGAAVAAAVVALRAWSEGLRYGGNSPYFVCSLAAAVLVTYLVSVRLLRRGERALGRWLLATGASLLLYLIATALAVEYGGLRGQRDLFTQTAVILHAAGYILPITLLQVCLVVAGARLGVVRHRGQWCAWWLLGYSALYLIFSAVTMPVGEPYQDIRPLWKLGGAEEWSWVPALPWMAGVFAGPLVLWRAVRRARGEVRSRTLTVAVLSLAPIGTILFCVLSWLMASWSGVLSVELGEAGLAVMFSLPFVVCALGLRDALESRAASGGERWMRVLATSVGVPFAIVVVGVSAIIGSHLGAVLPIVVATLLIAGSLAPLRRRLLHALAVRADPVRARTARLVQERGSDLNPARTTQEILRQALDEPDLRLLLRLPEQRGWVTVDGLLEPEAGVPMGESARLLMTHASSADVLSCQAEVAPLIDRALLEVAVRDQAARVEKAVSDERRRLERDLHDGVQGRLLALALDLKMAEPTVDGEARLLLNDAAESLTAAIGELRALAGGSVPDLLSRRGLKAALTDLTGGLPTPVRLSIPEERLPADVETVAYMVACEAVTNALKHAGAESITVEVAVEAGCVTVRVSDDGCGGADLRAGTGLRGLSERVRTAGGHLMISDDKPHGTLLEVVLPCG
ncbi:histidine kinase [Nonomuraea polychroma]|uniref:sensor histidine kinase n=1 Tax=Nonomuraea polychroma TaxID=46176 RepID=UPI003D90CE32